MFEGKAIIKDLIKGNLLLAEKRPYISRVIKDQLEAQDFKVFLASNEDEIFKIIEDKNVEIALIDFELLKGTYPDLCFKMKNYNENSFLPILMLLETKELEDELFKVNILFDEFILVPVNYIELVAKIHGLMRIKKLQETLLLKNKDLVEKSNELEDVNKRLLKLNNLSKKIYSSLNTSEIMQILMKDIPSLFSIALCSFFFYDNQNKSLKLGIHNHPNSGIPTDHTIAMGQSAFFNQLIKEKCSRLIRDVEKEMGIKNKAKYKSKSSINLVLTNNDEILGILNLNDKLDAKEFTQEDFIIALTFAEHLSLAIANAKLFEKTMELSIRDGLTGLFNRRFFQDKLKEEIERTNRYKAPLSLIFADIDNFKNFNDQYGHQAGDFILQEISLIIQENSREIDTAARYGGEEIVLLLPQTPIQSARILADRIINKIRNFSLVYNDTHLRITISIGIAEYEVGIAQEEFVTRADSVLKEAKITGKDKIVEWMKS
ncbi:diguanylate cyclase [bacterium]|nr:diguanylate cyclase [bacterium]